MTTLVWFRRDCRLHDHEGVHWAATRGPVAFGYVHAHSTHPWRMGAAQQSWVHDTLATLQDEIESGGGQLLLATGNPVATILKWVQELGATAVVVSLDLHPESKAWDHELSAQLKPLGVELKVFDTARLTDSSRQYKADGTPFRVFTPFWKQLQTLDIPTPLGVPKWQPAPRLEGASLRDLFLKPAIPWDKGFNWVAGRKGAFQQLERFFPVASKYGQQRNTPSRSSTSGVSPYMALGVVSPREVWHSVSLADASVFLSQVGWREFAYHTFEHTPSSSDEPLQPAFNRFPWVSDRDSFTLWSNGMTGYPIVDAGMRELWATGWMHNRVRMIVASFLVKHLLIPWQDGASWFWDTLIDADLPNNSLGWQWVAGCGVDAAPYFRIFNPILQGKKFDPYGQYVKQWIPELTHVSTDVIHEPGHRGYAPPIVELGYARQRALDALAQIR